MHSVTEANCDYVQLVDIEGDADLIQLLQKEKLLDLSSQLINIKLKTIKKMRDYEIENLITELKTSSSKKEKFRRLINKHRKTYNSNKQSLSLSFSSSSSSVNHSKSFDYLFKILLIGDAACGKSAIDACFTSCTFHTSYISTIGVDYHFRTLNIFNKIIKLQIWDTAGNQRFRTITKAYYRSADAIFIIFDLTNKESFNSVNDWLMDINNSNIYKMICGNKNDLILKRVINNNDAMKLSNKYNCDYIECSAKTGDNIENMFINTAKYLMESISISDTAAGNNSNSNSNHIHEELQKKTKNITECCCAIL